MTGGKEMISTITRWRRFRSLAWLAVAAGFAVLQLAVVASAEVVHTPVRGYIELTSGEYYCSWGADNVCHPCVNDADTPDEDRLMVAFGVTGPGYVAYGEISGTVAPFVEIDGVTLTPDLLPVGSFFRSGLYWQDYFVPSACPNGDAPGVVYNIGSLPEGSGQADGTAVLDIPKEDASLIPFSIRFCNEFVYWGVGCGVAGSQTNRWRLHLPQELRAFVVPGGDAPPVVPAGLDIVVDFREGVGGTLSMTHGLGSAPVGESLMGVPGYWEVNTDMPQESFVADVILSFAAADLPPGVQPEELTMVVYDAEAGGWRDLLTVVDPEVGTATATTDRLSVMALAVDPPVELKTRSWGAVKATYR
jgi:hypothetical protein